MLLDQSCNIITIATAIAILYAFFERSAAHALKNMTAPVKNKAPAQKIKNKILFIKK